MLTHEQFVEKIQQVKSMGYVRTHRKGDTGIGKTLEDLLGIAENNIQAPDTSHAELKAGRKNSMSMVTLFTKSPLPNGVNGVLLNKYGYPSPDDSGLILHCTINGKDYNNLKGCPFFKVQVMEQNGKPIIGLVHHKDGLQAYWDFEQLKEIFMRKYPYGQLYYVKADKRGSGENESFWFSEAYFLKGFDYMNFLKLISDGLIKVDFRMGQYPDGRPHDHGTGFRIIPEYLDQCFAERQKII